MRGTTAGRRPFATAAEATSTADMDAPFATGDAPGTDVTTTVIAIVVSAGATAAVANDKQVASGNLLSFIVWTFYVSNSAYADNTHQHHCCFLPIS